MIFSCVIRGDQNNDDKQYDHILIFVTYYWLRDKFKLVYSYTYIPHSKSTSEPIVYINSYQAAFIDT